MNGTAQPGPLYKVARVTFPAPLGTVTARDFESDHAVKANGRPSPSLEKNTVFGIENAYRNHGYLDAKVSVTPTKDATAHTISYAYSVVPGEVYHMRSLVFGGGMTAQQQSLLTQAWKLPQGAVYEDSTAQQSLHAKSIALVCGGPLVLQTLIPDRQTHQVDVNLTCSTHPTPNLPQP